jgi:hypothetical protein
MPPNSLALIVLVHLLGVALLDELNKAQRYQSRADECRRLAEIGNSSDIRNHYLRMAEYYAAFAEAEEARAEEAKGRGSIAISRAPSLRSVAPHQF